MKLSSTRTLEGLKPVLKDPTSRGPDPAYWVFSEISSDKWANLTITSPGNYNDEFPKTFGHYHSTQVDETYKLIQGEGIFIMQSKFLDEKGIWIEDKVKEVFLIQAKIGDEILITPQWGHSWSNIGEIPLITFDNWTSGHQPSDYEVIERLHGLSYYLVENQGKPTPVANPNYKDLPDPVWISASDFAKRV